MRSIRTQLSIYSRLRDVRCFTLRICKLLCRRHEIATYLRNHKVAKLQIGCGPNRLPGWLNTEGYPFRWHHVYLDARQPFPFADKTFDYVFTEHQIEHLSFSEAQIMLREIRRILKPAGILRVATPSLEKVCGLLANPKDPIAKAYTSAQAKRLKIPTPPELPATAVNAMFYEHGHQYIYDYATLRWQLEQAGFTTIAGVDPGKSHHSALQNIEKHGEILGSEHFNQLETMVLEAH